MAAIKSHQHVSLRQGLLVQRRMVKVKQAYFKFASQDNPAFLGDARAGGWVGQAWLVNMGIDLFCRRQFEHRNLQPLLAFAKVQPVFKRLVRIQNDVQQAFRVGFGKYLIQQF